MEAGRRAKIFAPFDALRGFSDAVSAREISYEPFRAPDTERMEILSRKLALLLPLVENSGLARKNQVRLEVTYFCPCEDPDIENHEFLGRYRTLEGRLKKIDPVRFQLQLDDQLIDLDDIYDIRDPDGKLFPETDC